MEDGECQENRVVMPGDLIDGDLVASNVDDDPTVILGPGVKRTEDGRLVATRCGILRQKPSPRTYWLDTHSRRYVAAIGDRIIGVIVGKLGADAWKVDVGTADYATISYLSFEGVTKRTKPNLRPGDLLYCRVLLAGKDVEPEVVCIDGEGKARGLGQLTEPGLLLRCSLNLVRRLLQPSGRLLTLLGERLAFEITCGVNGRLWIRAADFKHVVAIANTLTDSEFVADDQISVLVEQNIKAVQESGL